MRPLSSRHAPVLPPPMPVAGPWARAWGQEDFRRWVWGLLLVLGALVGVIIPPFFAWVQQRPGVLLPDPLLTLLPRYDVATFIFVFMYGAVGLSVGWQLRRPWLLLRGLWAYALLLGLRLLSIWLVPLAPPLGLLPMPDPFITLVFQAQHSELVTHDLFFSGHTATVALLALAVRGRWWRLTLGLLTLAVGVLVLVQRVHYSYDVLAAPLFAWLAYAGVGRVAGRRG